MTLPLIDAPLPNDQPARDAVRRELAKTLFVEAGAGTGKTAALVDRVVALVTCDGPDLPVPMQSVAAITFTEKAAAELRDRIRHELQRRAGSYETQVAARARAALEELDGAAICTLHAFAQRILTAFPIEAGLPPRIVVRDEISSRVAFESRWKDLVEEMFDAPAMEATVLAALAAGVKPEQLRAVAEVLDDNWDLLDRVADPGPVDALVLDDWLSQLDGVCANRSTCRSAEDRLLQRIEDLADYGSRVRSAFDDADRIRLLKLEKPSFRVANRGQAKNWPDIASVRDGIVALGDARDALLDELLDRAIRHLVAELAKSTAQAVAERRAAGELEFHDLLVLARTLLRDPAHGARVRSVLRQRYRRILIDEFQDTDPIQVDLAALLGSSEADDGRRTWDQMTVEPGRVFFVGDPKQSIYRFRRADIATFLAASDHFADPAPEYLTTNFRTAPGVLDWINHVFVELIRPIAGSQPSYRPLEAARPVPADHERHVVLLGPEPHDDADVDAAELRRREAADVASAIGSVIADAWQVFDVESQCWRSASLGDICILLPARTSLTFLEDALDEAGIPYRAESSSLVYGTREIRDLLAVMRAIDDPSDSLSLVTALRSAVFGCGDDDLFVYHVEHGGRWDVRVDPPETLASDHPVSSAMRWLGELHDARVWSTPSELLERVVRDRHIIEVGAVQGRFRDVARRVRFLVDQARAFADAAGGTLRDYLAWAQLQGTEGARVVEAVLPETDDDAVRILTIHGAKGLEFPIVICSGTTTAAQYSQRGVRVLFPPGGGYEVKLASGVQTAHFELQQPIDEQMGFDEKLRLLYVACTRARDHLIVSVHRKARDLAGSQPSHRTLAELLWNAAQSTAYATLETGAAAEAEPTDTAGSARSIAPEVWRAEYERAHARGIRRDFVAATALAHRDEPAAVADDPGLAKDARDLELPPWNKGRYGTAIGRAVHATLQTVDLATGDGLDATAAAQAAAEGVLGRESTIRAVARAALGSPSVVRAALRPHWRETYVAVPLDGITLEGYVDLVYRDDDGLVVVDYKTDAVNPAVRAERIVHYRIQAAAYALAVAESTGERVARCVLAFLEPGRADEVIIEGDDLASAVESVRALAAAERDSPSPIPAAVLVDG